MTLTSLNNVNFDNNFYIEINDTLSESLSLELNNLLVEAATLTSMVNTSKKDSMHIGIEVDKKKLIEKIQKLVLKAYKDAEKKPLENPKPIMRIRYVTAGESSKPASIKETDIKTGGRPKEIVVYPPSKGDFEKKAENAEKGTSRTSTLGKYQIRVKQSNMINDYVVISLQFLLGVILDKKLYNVKGSGNKILEFASAAAPVLFDTREKMNKLADTYKFKKPTIYPIDKIEKNIVDAMVKSQSQAAKDKKSAIAAANSRKEEGIKDDYSISVYSYRNNKITVNAKIAVEKIANSMGYTKISGSELPSDWNGTKKAWSDKVKEIKENTIENIKNTFGSKTTVSWDTAWINIFHQL